MATASAAASFTVALRARADALAQSAGNWVGQRRTTRTAAPTSHATTSQALPCARSSAARGSRGGAKAMVVMAAPPL